MTQHPTEPTDRQHLREDERAQQHPEGNVPQQIEDPEVGLPVENGEPAGEVNGEGALED